MSDQNITVVVQRTWQVLVIRDDNEQQHDELIDDMGFETYPEALLYAAQQADQYGVGITYHADSFK